MLGKSTMSRAFRPLARLGATLLAGGLATFFTMALPASSAQASGTWVPYMSAINTNPYGYGGSVSMMATGPSPSNPSVQTVWAGGTVDYCFDMPYPPSCSGTASEPAAWAWDPSSNSWDGPYTSIASVNPWNDLGATLEGMMDVNGQMEFAIEYISSYYTWDAWIDMANLQGSDVAAISLEGAPGTTWTSAGKPSVTPGPGGSALLVADNVNGGGNTLLQVNPNGSVSNYGLVSSAYPGIVGPDGYIYNVVNGQKLVNGTWQTVANLATSYTSLFWGPDARLWALVGSSLEEWNGSAWSSLGITVPATTLGVIVGPQGDPIASNGSSFYELQGGPTVSVVPSTNVTLQNSWTTWGEAPATTSIVATAMEAQGYDGNQQDWGNVTYQIGDVNPDGNWFNTQTVAGGNVGGPATNLPTTFGHLYSIQAAAQYLDPADTSVVLGGPISYGPTVNYFLPSQSGWNLGSAVEAETSTTITVEWPTVWKSSTQMMQVFWEPESEAKQNIWNWQYGSDVPYPQHSYTITGLTPNTAYDVALQPVEPSGGPWFSVGGWSVTTDSAPTGTLQINGGAPTVPTNNVTLTVTADNGVAPPVAVRFSQNDVTWGPWQALPQTPLSGSPVVGNAGLEGYYFAANTSLAANETMNTSSDYGHFNHFMYSENDAQVNFPYGSWPTNTYGNAPQAILNSGSPTNTGADWSTVWQGYVYAPVSGSYTFATPSDDGAVLDVNGQNLVQDINVQGMPAASAEEGTITLSAGQWYPVTLYYDQAWGGAGILFEWQEPGGSMQPIPSSDLWNLSPSYIDPNANAITQSMTVPWSFPAGTGGTQTVYAQVMDLDGTVSSVFSASTMELIASSPPVIHMTLNNGASTTSVTSVPVLLSVQGAGFSTGQGQMQVQVDGGSWSAMTPFSPSTTVTIPNTPGTHTITVQVEDENGLESQASAQIVLVSTAQSQQTGGSGSVITVAGATAATINGQTVQIVPSGQIQATFNPPSGTGGTPTMMSATHDGMSWSPWLPYAPNMDITLQLGSVNTVGVKFEYQDDSQSSVYTIPVLPLVKAPSLTASWQGGATATSTGSMTAVISVADSALPVTDLQYSVDGGTTWAAVPSATFSATVTLSTTGTNTVTIEVRDPAGNVGSTTLTAWNL